MLALPDDCLYIIFEYLGIKDQLSCAKAHPRFCASLVDGIWKTKLNPWQASFGLTSEDYNDVFSLNTGQMKALSIGHSRRYEWLHMDIAYSSKFVYPRLKSIYVIEYDLLRFLDSNPSLHYPNLESLHVLDDDAELSFGRLCAPKAFSQKRSGTGYLVYDWSLVLEQSERIQQELGLHLKVMEISYYRCFHFELFKLKEEGALSSLELLIMYFDQEFSHVLQLDVRVATDVKELGYHCLREPYVWDFCCFPEVRKLHLSRITATFWELLECCPAVDSIYLDYRSADTSLETELNHYAANFVQIFHMRASLVVEQPPEVNYINIHFPRCMKTGMEHMVGCTAPLSFRRRQGYYQFQFYFDVKTDELCSCVEPSLHLYF